MRGSDFRHLTFTVDGFATPYLLHTVRGVEDRGPTGSVAMINSDVLEDVTLLNGSYSQLYAGHTGAEVDFRLRDGSRQRRIVHIAVSGTNASAVAEGPIGSRQRGSWLISGRQSYLDLIVHRSDRPGNQLRIRGRAGESGLRPLAAPARGPDRAGRPLALRERSRSNRKSTTSTSG